MHFLSFALMHFIPLIQTFMCFHKNLIFLYAAMLPRPRQNGSGICVLPAVQVPYTDGFGPPSTTVSKADDLPVIYSFFFHFPIAKHFFTRIESALCL